MNYCTEFFRIASIARDNWCSRYTYEVAFAVIMVDQGIRNAFFFSPEDDLDHAHIPNFIKGLNSGSEKKYNFFVENGYISKHKINTTNKSRAVILGHSAPDWYTAADEKQNSPLMLNFRCLYGNYTVYQEAAPLTKENMAKIGEKYELFSNFAKSVNLNFLVFDITTYKNTGYVYKELLKMLKNPKTQDHEILRHIQNNKKDIIDFLVVENYFQDEPSVCIDEFDKMFNYISLVQWKAILAKFQVVK